MKTFPYFGPSVVVLIAAGCTLVAVPMVVRRAHDAQATADIVRASNVLALPAVMPFGGADDDGKLALEGARDPVGDELRPAQAADKSAKPASSASSAPRETILEQLNRANRAIAKLVEPSVVHVSAVNTMRRRGDAMQYSSSGSGWIWDEAGHIVTNSHVVEGADRMQVQLFDGELREAELVGVDLRTDIAVIKVASGGLHASLRGDSAEVEQGDMVYAFGSPFDFRFSMSSGIVSGLGRSAGLDNIDYENFIQTDAAINPGNSGGPLTDIRGRVVGMNTAIATGRGNTVGQAQFAGIGLAIPMSMIESTVTQLIETGEVRKGYLGVEVLDIEAVRAGMVRDRALMATAERFKGEGAMLGRVTGESPADKAGFRSGDVITAVDGRKVGSDTAVRATISSRRPGDTVRFDVWRIEAGAEEAKRIELTATLAQLDASINVAPFLPPALKMAGIDKYETATDERARKLEVPFRRGVLIEQIREGSDIAGMVPVGSTITAIFDQPIGSMDEMYTRCGRAFAELRTRRVDVPFTIIVPDGRVAQISVPVTAR